MILQRLYELATRPGEGLLDEVAFEDRPVPFIIKVGDDGRYLGIEERRGEIVLPSRKKGGEPKRVPDKGKPTSVPRATATPRTLASHAFLPIRCRASCQSATTRRAGAAARRSGSSFVRPWRKWATRPCGRY